MPLCRLRFGSQREFEMKKVMTAAVLLLTLGVSACNTPGERAVGGGLLGAGAGALIGGAAGGGRGAAIGAIAGGATGAVVGANTLLVRAASVSWLARCCSASSAMGVDWPSTVAMGRPRSPGNGDSSRGRRGEAQHSPAARPPARPRRYDDRCCRARPAPNCVDDCSSAPTAPRQR